MSDDATHLYERNADAKDESHSYFCEQCVIQFTVSVPQGTEGTWCVVHCPFCGKRSLTESVMVREEFWVRML